MSHWEIFLFYLKVIQAKDLFWPKFTSQYIGNPVPFTYKTFLTQIQQMQGLHVFYSHKAASGFIYKYL